MKRPPRVLKFTDTLGDVNGVSRFIRNIASLALEQGRALSVITSTNFEVPRQPNIVNVPPLAATRMPKYENLELVLPNAPRMLDAAKRFAPDVIHVSTPGGVGLVGLLAARRLRVPLVGVYHTDFPAYVERLFRDDSMAFFCRGAMRRFYAGFAAIFTRSEDYAANLRGLGLPGERLLRLRPGIRIDDFHPRFRATPPPCLTYPRVRVLSVGRVSVEKNLHLLTRVWPEADARLKAMGVDAELVVVGDGPYRRQMEEELAGGRVRFMGFRHGEELSRIYAACDLFAFPSTTDTLGQVVMESQASGVPVVVSDEGGPREIVDDGSTGFVIPVRETRRWIDAIVRLASDFRLRRQMGEAAHRKMQAYSIAGSFEHYWSVHEEVAARHAARDR